MYQRNDYSYLPTVRKSNSYHSTSNYQPSTSNYHVSRGYDRSSDNYISSYLVRKGPKKIEEPSHDYNFEEYFRILPPSLYSRYYNSHKFLNQGKRFFPNLRLQLNRLTGLAHTSSNSSSVISTPSSTQSRSTSPIHRSLSPHFNTDFNSELVDGIQLSRAKSPLLSRPLSPIESTRQIPFNVHLSAPLTSTKVRSKSASSHSIYRTPSVRNEELIRSKGSSEIQVNSVKVKNKSQSHHALNELKIDDMLNNETKKQIERNTDNLSDNQQTGNLTDPNLIRMLSQNIIELTENLNLLFGNEHDQTANSTESNDNDLIEKIDQLRRVSKRLKDCTEQQATNQNVSTAQQIINQQVTNQQTDDKQTQIINQTNLANQLNVVALESSETNDLKSDQIEPEFAECKPISHNHSDHLERAQIHQQEIIQPITSNQTSQLCNQNENEQFNEQNKDKLIKQIEHKKLEATRPQIEEREESQDDDEFFECTNDEQKDLRKSLFKGSKLNLEQLIDKAIDEQLLGQWLKLSDSLEEDGPAVQGKHSIEELKHKFATKLAIIHYKLYQKYSKSKPIQNAKKWRNRKLNKGNKLQSKYTLLQGLMDDDQFIQFLMDKINYFMHKIKQCKSQRKELKKGVSKLELNRDQNNCILHDETLTVQSDEFVKNDSNCKSIDENNNEIEIISDENNNEILPENQSITEEMMDRDKKMAASNSTQDGLSDEDKLIEKLNEEVMNSLIDEFHDEKPNKTVKSDEMEKRGISKYAILFLFTLIVFMILIIFFRSISFAEVSKKCTNCVRTLDSNQLLLRPVHQLKQIKHPACDHRIMLEAQRLLGSRN